MYTVHTTTKYTVQDGLRLTWEHSKNKNKKGISFFGSYCNNIWWKYRALKSASSPFI